MRLWEYRTRPIPRRTGPDGRQQEDPRTWKTEQWQGEETGQRGSHGCWSPLPGPATRGLQPQPTQSAEELCLVCEAISQAISSLFPTGATVTLFQGWEPKAKRQVLIHKTLS